VNEFSFRWSIARQCDLLLLATTTMSLLWATSGWDCGAGGVDSRGGHVWEETETETSDGDAAAAPLGGGAAHPRMWLHQGPFDSLLL